MITYPNKDFGIEFKKKKIIKRKNIEIKVIGFRTRIVKKQIAHWGKSIIEAEEVKEKKKEEILL